MSGFNGVTFKGLTEADIVNNLTSTATDKPLSAAQGKALNDYCTSISTKNITLADNLFSASTLQCFKIGRIVQIDGSLTVGSSNIPAWTDLFYLEEGCRHKKSPEVAIYTPDGSSIKDIYGNINASTSKEFFVNRSALLADKTYYVHIIYISIE